MPITRTLFGETEKPIMVEISGPLTPRGVAVAHHPSNGGTVLFRVVIRLFLLFLFLLPHWGPGGCLSAHPMPNSMVVLNVHEKHITGELMLPLGELQSAIGMSVNDRSEGLIQRLGDTLRRYLKQHIRPRSFEGKPWSVTLGEMRVIETKNELTGDYKELIVPFEMAPPEHYDLRNFYFDYDVILHQVASHKVLVNVRQDWERGLVREDTVTQQVGVIEWDMVQGKLQPFQVSLQQGSAWRGFQNMVSLGVSHIAEGTDHMLFLLTLLLAAIPYQRLPTPQRVNKGGSPFGTVRRAVGPSQGWGAVLKIVTAFTVGHSLTLLLGAVQWLHFPSKPIEVLIAVTILVSAFHAFRPIYPKREVLIAGSFGLIHGLAFAETLTNLQLSTKQLVLSILGFNVGIELMQLFLILLVFPVLLLLSKTRYYTFFRQAGAVVMMLLALAWMIERIQEKPNFITALIS
ncbi:MAG: HupE/UreJ family protein [Spirosomataceae bacterium]